MVLNGIDIKFWSTRIFSSQDRVIPLGLDFSKAYDCVDKFLCVDILKTIGADEKTCSWILDFLQDRYLIVKVKDKFSSGYCPDYGILQGSSLSPTLFALISSDLIEALNGYVSKVCMYADDSCAIIEYKTVQEGIGKVKQASKMAQQTLQELEVLTVWISSLRKCNG